MTCDTVTIPKPYTYTLPEWVNPVINLGLNDLEDQSGGWEIVSEHYDSSYSTIGNDIDSWLDNACKTYTSFAKYFNNACIGFDYSIYDKVIGTQYNARVNSESCHLVYTTGRSSGNTQSGFYFRKNTITNKYEVMYMTSL